MIYKYPASNTYQVSYGQLRKWADECKEVKDWMMSHLDKEVFEAYRVPFTCGHVYEFHSGAIALLASAGDRKYILIDLSHTPGNRFGEPRTVEDLHTIHGGEIKRDLGALNGTRFKNSLDFLTQPR